MGLVILPGPAGQGLHRQQPLHAPGHRHKEAEPGDAGRHTGKALPDVARHKLGQIPLLNLPLGLLGGQLPLGGLDGGPLYGGGQLLLLLVQRPVQQGGKHPVDHQVGITADGGGEMAVIFRPQAEVAQVVPVVPGLHQGAQHHHGHRPLLRLSLGPVQQLLEGMAVRPLQIVAQRGHHGTQGLPLLVGGLLMDPVDAGLVEAVQVLRHALVGRQHKGLDELLALPLLPQGHVHRLALTVADHIAFLGLQVQGSPVPPQLLQLLGQSRHVPQHGQDVGVPLRQGGVLPRQQHVAVLVSHPLGGADHRFGDGVVHHRSIAVHGHDAGQGQPVHMGVQGADTVGQLHRQHGHHLVGKIH